MTPRAPQDGKPLPFPPDELKKLERNTHYYGPATVTVDEWQRLLATARLAFAPEAATRKLLTELRATEYVQDNSAWCDQIDAILASPSPQEAPSDEEVERALHKYDDTLQDYHALNGVPESIDDVRFAIREVLSDFLASRRVPLPDAPQTLVLHEAARRIQEEAEKRARSEPHRLADVWKDFNELAQTFYDAAKSQPLRRIAMVAGLAEADTRFRRHMDEMEQQVAEAQRRHNSEEGGRPASTPSPREPSEPLTDHNEDATADVADRLRAFIRKHLHGQCKILSLGPACLCALCDADRIISRAAPVSSSPPRTEKLSLMEVLRDWRSWWPTEFSDELTLSGKQANELCGLLVDAPAGAQQGARLEVVALVDAHQLAIANYQSAVADNAHHVILDLWHKATAARSALLAAIARAEQKGRVLEGHVVSLEAHVGQLETALNEYGEHTMSCSEVRSYKTSLPCQCGLDAVLSSVREMPSTPPIEKLSGRAQIILHEQAYGVTPKAPSSGAREASECERASAGSPERTE